MKNIKCKMQNEKGARPCVIAVGEVLWDVFSEGARLGGAPANFAVHAASLGADAFLVSRVGRDKEGETALRMLAGRGLNVDFVQVDEARPTGTVPVTVVDGEPSYEIVEGAAWDAIAWEPRLEGLAQRAQAVCFGSLAQREATSRRTLQRFVEAVPEGCMRVVDINFRQHYHSRSVVDWSLRFADLLKLNDEEVRILRGYLGGSEDDGDFLREVCERFRIGRAVLTLGAEGCRVIGPREDVRVAAAHQDVVNTVGAGDAFTAAFVLNLLAGQDVRACAERANQAGGYVTTQDGAIPEFPETFRVF